MTDTFKNDYRLLELDERADWKTAKVHYRRLVNRWHPDRFAQRPRERIHAQARFIELTQAFTSLRKFYQKNQRLPYEPTVRRNTETSTTRMHASSPSQSTASSATTNPAPAPDTASPAEYLWREKPAPQRAPTGRRRQFMWLVPVLLVLLAGTLLFAILDRNFRQQSMETGKEVLRTTEPSPYLR